MSGGTFTFLLLQGFTTQGTDTFEHKMTSFFESLYHFVGCRIPFSFLSVRRTSIPLLFRPWTPKCPTSLREFHRVILDFLGIRIQFSSLFCQSMSLNVKIIRSGNSSAWIFRFSKSCWIYSRIDNDENPRKFVDSNSNASPSIPTASW